MTIDSSSLLGRFFGERTDPEAQAAEERRAQELARARRWPEFKPEELKTLDGTPGWLTDGERVMETMPIASDPGLHYVIGFVMIDGQPRYLRPPSGGPSSMALWEHRRDAARREDEQAEKERARELAATPPRVVTIDVLEGRPFPTPRQAFEQFSRLHGECWVDDAGRLQAGWRGSAVDSSYNRQALVDALRVLFLCEPIIIDYLQNGTPLPVDSLTPAGAVAVAKPAESAQQQRAS